MIHSAFQVSKGYITGDFNSEHVGRLQKEENRQRTWIGQALGVKSHVKAFFAALGVVSLYIVSGGILAVVDLAKFKTKASVVRDLNEKRTEYLAKGKRYGIPALIGVSVALTAALIWNSKTNVQVLEKKTKGLEVLDTRESTIVDSNTKNTSLEEPQLVKNTTVLEAVEKIVDNTVVPVPMVSSWEMIGVPLVFGAVQSHFYHGYMDSQDKKKGSDLSFFSITLPLSVGVAFAMNAHRSLSDIAMGIVTSPVESGLRLVAIRSVTALAVEGIRRATGIPICHM